MPSPKLFKIGTEIVEALNPVAKRRELAELGKVSHTAQIVEHVPSDKLGKVKMVDEVTPVANDASKAKFAAGVAAPVTGSPMDALKDLGQQWQNRVVSPISEQLKSTLTPELNVQGQAYPTASAGSNFIIDQMADPVNYVPGGAGAILGGAEAVANYSDGGLVKKSDEGVHVYDLSSGSPVLGQVPHDQLEGALASGQFTLPQGAKVPVMSPDGQLGDVPSESAMDAIKAGYKYATPDMQQQAKFGTAEQAVKAGLEGAVDSASFGLAGGVTNVLNKVRPDIFASSEDRLARAEANPGSRMVGQLAGILTPMGAGGVMAKVGEAVASRLVAKTVMGRVGSAAAKAAVENTIFAGSDEVAKAFMKDPQQNAESVMANLGLSAVIGGAVGGAGKGATELWDATAGKQLHTILSSIKNRASGLNKQEAALAGLDLPDSVIATMAPGFAREQGVALSQSDTFAGRHYQKNLSNTYTQLEDQVNNTLGKSRAQIEALSDLSDHAVGTQARDVLVKDIQAKYEPLRAEYKNIENKLIKTPIAIESKAGLETAITDMIASEGLAKSANVAPEALRMAQGVLKDLPKQETAQDLRMLAQNIRDSAPFGTERYKVGKQLITIIKKTQDEATAAAADAIGPDVAAQFKATQSQYRQFKTQLDDLNAYLRVGRSSGAESFTQNLKNKLDGADVIKRLGRDNVELRQMLETTFPDVATIAKQHELDTILSKSRTKSGDAIDINKLAKKLEAMDPESRQQLLGDKVDALGKLHDIADKLPKNDNYSGTAKAMDRIFGGLPASAGGIAGVLYGGDSQSGIIGAVAGALGHQATPAIRLAMLKFLASDVTVSAKGLRAAVDVARAAERSEKMLNKEVTSVFEAKNGTVTVSKEAIDKLKGQVNAVSENPELLLGMGGDAGHYMPEHAQAVSMSTARSLNYLASLRPQTAPMSPFDSFRKVSKEEDGHYNRALEIAENPMIVLNDVKDGRIDPKDLQHLSQLAPALQAKMRQKLTEQMIAHIEKGQSIPYKTQIGLSLFMGQPLASSLQPQAIMASQPKPQPPQGSPKSGKAMQMPAMYQTPGQARQAKRAGRK